MEEAEKRYDAARELAARTMRAMVEAHDLWDTASQADQSHPATAEITAKRWACFQETNDLWQQAMAALKVARRRYERLRG